jgi:hypothetical protein
MAGSERSNSATADTRAADRTADKTQTPTATSEAPSADSHVPTEATASSATTARTADKTQTPTATSADSRVPTEATASSATTARTGFRRVGDRGNCEEQDRGGGNASHQAGLGGVGCSQCRCARQRLEGLIVLVQIGSALR